MIVQNIDMKPKDETIDVAKQWYAEIAELRQKYQLLVLMWDSEEEKFIVRN